MTKKDYEKFAKAIHDLETTGQDKSLIDSLIDVTSAVFSEDNPLFNKEKYTEACYEGKHIRKSIKNQ